MDIEAKKFNRVVVAIYIDTDFFPPTINAILNLAEISEEVCVICRNNNAADYPFPKNVFLNKIGDFATVREMEKQSTFSKVNLFVKFARVIRKKSKSRKTDLVLLFDHLALFGFYISKIGIGKKNVWYHNHDMPNKTAMGRVSIGKIAAEFEKKGMQGIRYFSLPAVERLKYYPAISPLVQTFIIPNYPSLKVYNRKQVNKKDDKVLKIIFQGFIGEGHGLEGIISLLNETINGYSFQLFLKGSVSDKYKQDLQNLAQKYQVENKLIWVGIGPYKDLPALTETCHIGIGINSNTDRVSLAQGTASNKIYEYAASGLPVILYDSKQFRNYLEQYNWAFFSDGSIDSLRNVIKEITLDLDNFSEAAKLSFKTNLNFENKFNEVIQNIVANNSK